MLEVMKICNRSEYGPCHHPFTHTIMIIKSSVQPVVAIHCIPAVYLSRRVKMRARTRAITARTARIDPDTSRSRPVCSKNSLRLTPKIALVAMSVLFCASL